MAQNVSAVFSDPEFRKKYYRKLKTGGGTYKFDGVRAVAQDHGFIGNEVVQLTMPSPENDQTAVVVQRIHMMEPDDQVHTYEGIGDANAKNANGPVAVHLVRMASTRALARAFRNALKIEAVVYEELAEGDLPPDVIEDDEPQSGETQTPPAKAKTMVPVGSNSTGGNGQPHVDTDLDTLWEEFSHLDPALTDDDEEDVDALVDQINEYLQSNPNIHRSDVIDIANYVIGHANLRQASCREVKAVLDALQKL